MKTASTNKPPEAFFKDRNAEKLPGKVFVTDSRVSNWKDLPNGKSEWVPQYAYPTELAEKVASEYPMGAYICAIEVIQRDNGDLLTVLRKECAGNTPFVVDVWAGLAEGVKENAK
jgi:hypothetical protein